MANSVRPEVEILAGEGDTFRQGSGVFLGGRLVLTQAHVTDPAKNNEKIRVRTVDGNTYDCQIVWSSTETVRAASLLKIVDATWKSDLDFPPVSFGRIKGEGVINCQIIGFPVSAQYRDPKTGQTYRDTIQLSGVISPLAGVRSGLITINVTPPHTPTREDIYGRSPWIGLTGAPVQCQGHLVGIVLTVRGDVFNAVRIEKIAEDPHFTELAEKAIKGKITFTDVSRPESFADTVNSVIDGVATVDSSNTQQVAALELALSKAYYERVLTQARSSFIAALVSAGIGLMFFLAAISVSLVTGKLNAALISTISGAIIEVISGLNFWLYSQTSAQLDAFHLRIERMQRFLLANSVTTSVQDSQQKDKVISELVDTIAKSVVEVKTSHTQKPEVKGT